MIDDFPADYCGNIDEINSDEIMNQDESDSVSDDENGKGSDWIELSGMGKITRWKFPMLRTCPVLTCISAFDSRTATIRHYREEHAADVILCYLCDWPVDANDFQMHFRLIHPNEMNPFNFDSSSSESAQTETTQAHTENVRIKLLHLKLCK